MNTNRKTSVNSGKPKRSIEHEPTTPFGFVVMCIIFVFRRFVFSPTHVKIGLYFGTLIIGSLMKDFNLVFKSPFLQDKSNVFNVFFVKLGWFWTLLVTMPFVTMTSLVYTGGNVRVLRNNLFRLVIATALWFMWTKVFDFIDTSTGVCMSPLHKEKLDCKKNKHEWRSFDISGHTFILMHAMFLMLEEVKVYNNSWDQMRKSIRENISRYERENERTPDGLYGLSSSSETLLDRASYWFIKLNKLIKVNFMLMATLALLWEVMLFVTFLYYHTIMHKLMAASCAIASWFFTYKFWYVQRDLILSPGAPGEGIERFNFKTN